jgi:hypothetical protein
MSKFNLISSIKSNRFLQVNTGIMTNESIGTDTQELFKKNLTKQPSDWIYRTKSICYNLNKNLYRTYEFETIDWEKSVVIFGCSNVFGVGLAESDTVSAQLSLLINKPVINMGVGGTSLMYNLYNSVILLAGYQTPQAVIQLWSNYDRCTYFKEDEIVYGGAWNMKMGDYMNVWNQDPANPQTNAIFASKIFKQLCNGKTKYYEASFFKDTAELLECDQLVYNNDARDLIHPGINSAYLAAVRIAENLKL